DVGRNVVVDLNDERIAVAINVDLVLHHTPLAISCTMHHGHDCMVSQYFRETRWPLRAFAAAPSRWTLGMQSCGRGPKGRAVQSGMFDAAHYSRRRLGGNAR